MNLRCSVKNLFNIRMLDEHRKVKKMKKKLLSVLLAVVMTASLAACGGKGAGTASQTGSASAKTQETSAKQESSASKQEAAQGIDPEAPYEETVTITVGHKEAGNVEYPEGDDMYDNAWIRTYLERYNIKLEFAFAESGSEYETKVNLAMAENNLPDVFVVTAAQLDLLLEANLLYDLTEVFETYACDEIKSYAEGDPITFETAHRDGRLYAIPQFGSGDMSQIELVWIRKDWKEALNLADPQTMDDVVTIAEAFMEEYGAAYGIGTSNTLAALYYLAPAWGAYPDFWIEDENGQIVYGSIQPEMKEALAEWAAWYQSGIISENFATIDSAKLQEDTVNNKVGLYAHNQTWGWYPGGDMVKANGPEAVFEPYLIPSATGEQVLYPISCTNSNYIVISKDCEHPEAIFKMLKLHDLVRYDQDFAVNEPEMKSALFDNMMQHYPQAFRVLSNTFEQGILYQIQDALAKDDSSALLGDALSRYEECRKWMEEGDSASLGRYAQVQSFTIADKILTSEQTISNKVWGISTETMSQSGSILKDLLVEGFTKIIMGDEPVEYFDDLVESWKNAGGEKMTQEVNAYYGK